MHSPVLGEGPCDLGKDHKRDGAKEGMQLNRWAVSLLPRGAASVTNDRASRFLPVPWVCASGWHQVFAEARL